MERGADRPVSPRTAVFFVAGSSWIDFLHHAVERSALRAFAHVRRSDASTFLTDVTSVCFCHNSLHLSLTVVGGHSAR